MEIKKLDLNEIMIMVSCDMPNKRAKIVANSLRKVYFIYNECLYRIDENIICQKVGNTKFVEDKLLTIVTQLMEDSYSALDKDSRQILNDTKLNYSKIFSNNNVKSYLPQLINELENDKNKLDMYTYEVHFLNGVYNLKTNTMRKRVLGQDYVTFAINRNYEKPSKKSVKWIRKRLLEIFQTEEDLNCILEIYGSALSGDSAKNQSSLFQFGEGSNGKSLMLQLIEASVEKYLKELKSDTFSGSDSDTNKILNTFYDDPYIRYAWVNELVDKMIKGSAFKNFNDGRVSTTKLYRDGGFDFEHFAKLFLTGNNLPRIITDGGSIRRIIAYENKSKFVQPAMKDKVDNKKHIYLVDEELLNNFKNNDDQKNALFLILAEACNAWYAKNGKFTFTDSFKNAVDVIKSSNDHIQDFVDSQLQITNKPDDKIGKTKMMDIYEKFAPKHPLSMPQLIQTLKDKGINYNPQARADGMKGTFICVQDKHGNIKELEDDEYEEYDIPNSTYKSKTKTEFYKEDTSSLEKENEALKAEIKKLKEMMTKHATVKEAKKEEVPKRKASVKTNKTTTKRNDIDEEIDELYELF